MTEQRTNNENDKTNHVYQAVIEMIRDGVYLPGDKLPNERDLARRFETSRDVVRQALSMIQNRNLIVRRVGSGTYLTDNAAQIIEIEDAHVQPLSGGPNNFREILEARLMFEPAAAALAADNAKPDDLQRLQNRLDDLMEVVSWLEFKEAIYAVTKGIYEATGNSFLVSIFDQVIRHRRRVNYDGRGTESKVSELVKRKTHTELKNITDAVTERNGAKAQSLCQDYILGMLTSVNL
jgi:GntR family transcriptional repressor for pyruvate dehydrogenase complex